MCLHCVEMSGWVLTWLSVWSESKNCLNILCNYTITHYTILTIKQQILVLKTSRQCDGGSYHVFNDFCGFWSVAVNTIDKLQFLVLIMWENSAGKELSWNKTVMAQKPLNVICIWPSWCHCHSLSLASVKSKLVLLFWYCLTRVFLDKEPLNNRCVCVCNNSDFSVILIVPTICYVKRLYS